MWAIIGGIFLFLLISAGVCMCFEAGGILAIIGATVVIAAVVVVVLALVLKV